MKYVVFLGDGMSDEAPLPGYGDRTPLQIANTPNIDRIAREGRCGTFRSLPEGYPTSSDVANMSVMGFDLKDHTGRGPLEAMSQGLDLQPNQIAMRCNIITENDGTLIDYSGGHINDAEGRALIAALNEAFDIEGLEFVPGVQYRHLIILTGDQWSADVKYEKPDDHQGDPVELNLVTAGSPAAEHTAKVLRELTLKSKEVLEAHPLNQAKAAEGKPLANMIWPWSAGHRPSFPSFQDKYGKSGAIVSAVDVIFGIGAAAGMEMVRVEGATGWIDTNMEGKADAAVEALKRHDFVYLHVEAIDELSHLGDPDLKIKTLEEWDRRLVGRTMEALKDQEVTYAVIPDHAVPVRLRKHTRTPVPFAIWKPGEEADTVQTYDEDACLEGAYGELKADEFMKALFKDA